MTHLIKPQTTFCGVPFCDDISALNSDIAIIGAAHGTPYKSGAPSHAARAWLSVATVMAAWKTAKPTATP